MRIQFVAVLVPFLGSCASSGLYNMTDDWCGTHLEASAARCPHRTEERRVAVNDEKPVATTVATTVVTHD
ncbi:MAG: hypothetical protein JO184_14860 [Gammaproteobacteria bacterium]|nr:hypothetical protein [Gammaproteobacteria bacterium]MBV8403652.1 hypothetical protein [Gammaproteobacteria bacterium]